MYKNCKAPIPLFHKVIFPALLPLKSCCEYHLIMQFFKFVHQTSSDSLSLMVFCCYNSVINCHIIYKNNSAHTS